MPYAKRSVWFQVITTMTVYIFFGVSFWNGYTAGSYDEPDGFADLGKLLFLLVFIGIVVTIVVNIVGSILLAVVKKGRDVEFIHDERDRSIDFVGQKISQAVTGIGFVGSMALLAGGVHPALIFFLMLSAFALGDVCGNIARLLAYGGD